MNRGLILAVALTLLSVGLVLTATPRGTGPTEEWRAVGLVLLPTAILASLLVVYFDWRRRLTRDVRAERAFQGTPEQA